jgi:iodotyrosine deiodinase
MKENKFIPYKQAHALSDKEMLSKSEEFKQNMLNRRSIRDFSDREVNIEIIKNCITAAASAPSGSKHAALAFCSS